MASNSTAAATASPSACVARPANPSSLSWPTAGASVSKEARIPLTEQWQEHSIEFEIKTTFKDETTLRFRLPRDAKGTFDLADTRLKVVK